MDAHGPDGETRRLWPNARGGYPALVILPLQTLPLAGGKIQSAPVDFAGWTDALILLRYIPDALAVAPGGAVQIGQTMWVAVDPPPGTAHVYVDTCVGPGGVLQVAQRQTPPVMPPDELGVALHYDARGGGRAWLLEVSEVGDLVHPGRVEVRLWMGAV